MMDIFALRPYAEIAMLHLVHGRKSLLRFQFFEPDLLFTCGIR